MSPRIFLILPAVVPFALDVALTVGGQPLQYWNGDYDAVLEMAPVGRAILQRHPLAFVVASVAYAAIFSLAIRYLPAGLALWMSLGYLIAHASGANTWLLDADFRLEVLNDVATAGFAAMCYSAYFRRLPGHRSISQPDEMSKRDTHPGVDER